ncbi:HK97 gp10 family phage protein [soil metagenome]
MVKMTLTGAKELEAALRALPDRITANVVQRALMKAGEPIAADARARAPVRSGRLRDRITVAKTLSKRQRRGRGKWKGAVEAFIGASPARHAHLVEFGTGPRVSKKTGKSSGEMPAHPFMRPAWEAGKDKLLNDLGELLWAEIERAAKSLARRAKRVRRIGR